MVLAITMTTYTINYTETEDKAMQYVSADVNDWIQNAAHNRARIAIDEIVSIAVQKSLEIGQPIPGLTAALKKTVRCCGLCL